MASKSIIYIVLLVSYFFFLGAASVQPPFLKIYCLMTLQEKNEELAYIATLTDQQVCEAYNVDYRHDIIAIIEDEAEEDEEDDDEEYWDSYAEDMIIERKKEYSHF